MNAKMRRVSFDPDTQQTVMKGTALRFRDENEMTFKPEKEVVCIYPDYLFQTMEGFGCAMTETSCYLLSRMDAQTRTEALQNWFGPDGMNAKFIRIPIDSCDFSLDEYQAVADPIADPELETFSIDRDRKYILPVVKEALALSDGGLSVLLSPWSPPYQWKTPPEKPGNDAEVYGGMFDEVDYTKPGRCFGGRLKKEYYASWAKYLVKFVQAYLDEGIPVTMLSVQNEASAATNWDSCLWTGEEESIFLRDYLYPAMKEANLTDKIGIFIWDHNKERMIEHIDEMMENGICDLVEGFAYHWYSGDHFEALSLMHQKYPDKILMHSESCGMHAPGKTMPLDFLEDSGAPLPPEIEEAAKKDPMLAEHEDAVHYAHDIIGDLNHGMNRWIDWNMMVDRDGGPRHVPGGFAAPMVAEADGSFTFAISYHYLKTLSKAIRPGAVRIGISRYCSQVDAAAVKNTDGTVDLLLLNTDSKDHRVNIRYQGDTAPVNLKAGELITVEL